MAAPEQADSPASLYGVVSSVLGVIALITVVLAGHVGIAFPLLLGSLAVTFAVLGMSERLNRGLCTVGLVTGGLGVLYPVHLVVAYSA